MAANRSDRQYYDVSSGNNKRVKLTSAREQMVNDLTFSLQKCNHSDYTVGWICAITPECVAAQAFLDADHDTLDTIPRNDTNNYTLGQMGQHNVVIATLPMGSYGTASAARVAGDMVRTFPNVRIVLMVGIAGGAPTEEQDIRLGDVVVNIPCDGKDGVLQYDFGKAIQGKEFQITGRVNQPPMALMNAVRALQPQYKRDGRQLEEAINRALRRWPRLQRGFKRPDPNTDKLYRSKVTHPANNEEDCTKVCGDNPSKLVPRKPRKQGNDNPAIHYGTMASTDKLMKDALLRDKLAKEQGVLCFEMEAAGLAFSFPCLVIRGICDYSDTHKNKEWQGYAAMVAAAYAKDLLAHIPGHGVNSERRVGDIMSSGQPLYRR